MNKIENDLFLRACKRLPVDRTPVWIMRQAGRYLPEYRAIRQKYDFLTLCKTPDLAAEVTIQPVDIIGVDAAIIFSDILVIPEAMGMALSIEDGTGPVFAKPIRDESDAASLKDIDPGTDLKFVMDALSVTKKELNNRVPVIGFSGSPWTLLTYMVEGRGSKNFSQVKSLIFRNPKLAHKLLEKLAKAVAGYLSAQLESGANAVQIFDTWGGILSPEDYREFSLEYIKMIIASMKKNDEPVIVFSKGVHQSFSELASSGADVIGLDWTVDIGTVKRQIGNDVALQGNMDPTVLYADKAKIKKEVKRILQSYANAANDNRDSAGSGNSGGHIFNLGHGILPDIEPENARAFVEFVKEESIKQHSAIAV
ncbi:uroporphyrinogen decarboxylase [candidate division KSB1 bacterium]|nr:uroporphyrinogen decarboxylase [candidate division KSB1 bacterium]